MQNIDTATIAVLEEGMTDDVAVDVLPARTVKRYECVDIELIVGEGPVLPIWGEDVGA
jgi:hypothetical protein